MDTLFRAGHTSRSDHKHPWGIMASCPWFSKKCTVVLVYTHFLTDQRELSAFVTVGICFISVKWILPQEFPSFTKHFFISLTMLIWSSHLSENKWLYSCIIYVRFVILNIASHSNKWGWESSISYFFHEIGPCINCSLVLPSIYVFVHYSISLSIH